MSKWFPLLLSIALLASTSRVHSADAKTELQDLVGRVNSKIELGKHAEQDFGDELKEFDKLLAEHKGEKTEEVAKILAMKAMLYTEVFDNDEKAMELLKEVKTEFPGTVPGQEADEIIAALTKQQEAKKIERSLAAGSVFPVFDEKDLDGKPLSLAKYKGKIVLIDFWATWCPPCLQELPNVRRIYAKYHDKGFEIIGISLDEDKDTLAGFIKEKEMTWPQYYDGKQWQNKMALKYGVTQIPSTYLLGKDGKIIAKQLRGEELDSAVAKALNAN